MVIDSSTYLAMFLSLNTVSVMLIVSPICLIINFNLVIGSVIPMASLITLAKLILLAETSPKPTVSAMCLIICNLFTTSPP